MCEIETGVSLCLTSCWMKLSLKSFPLCSARICSKRTFITKQRLIIGSDGPLTFTRFSKTARRWIPNDRIQPGDDIHSAANFFAAGESRADTDEAANRRKDRQHHQRHPHRFR